MTKLLSKIYQSLPSEMKPTTYELYSFFRKDRDHIQIDEQNGLYKLTNLETNEILFVNNCNFAYRLQSGSYPSNSEKILNKYTLEGFVTVNDGDIIVDAGALFGEFSLSVVDKASQLIIIEPDPRLQSSLIQNTKDFDNVQILDKALAEEQGKIKMAFGNDPSENSLINVDEGGVASTKLVNTISLPQVITETNTANIDFFKLDAEGAEPEAIRGFGDARPTKVAIDAGAERSGVNTYSTVLRLLSDLGYETQRRGDMVFGILKSRK